MSVVCLAEFCLQRLRNILELNRCCSGNEHWQRSQLGDGLPRTLKSLSALLNAAEIIFNYLYCYYQVDGHLCESGPRRRLSKGHNGQIRLAPHIELALILFPSKKKGGSKVFCDNSYLLPDVVNVRLLCEINLFQYVVFAR